VEEEGSAGLVPPAPRQGEAVSRGGDVRQGGAARRGRTARDEVRTSARPSWSTAGDGVAHVSWRGGALGRSDTSERGDASERGLSSGRGTSGMGAARRGGGYDGGREARR
jgi:hypothetical protein